MGKRSIHNLFDSRAEVESLCFDGQPVVEGVDDEAKLEGMRQSPLSRVIPPLAISAATSARASTLALTLGRRYFVWSARRTRAFSLT